MRVPGPAWVEEAVAAAGAPAHVVQPVRMVLVRVPEPALATAVRLARLVDLAVQAASRKPEWPPVTFPSLFSRRC